MNNEKAQQTLDLLKNAFGSRNVALGILGNIDVETGGSFSSNQEQYKGGPGRGLFQMEGGMLKAYQSYLTNNSLENDSSSQVGFVKSALESGKDYDIGAGHRQKLKKAFESDDINTITEEFSNRFLRPGKPNLERRKQSANRWSDLLSYLDVFGTEAYAGEIEGKRVFTLDEAIARPQSSKKKSFTLDEAVNRVPSKSSIGTETVLKALPDDYVFPKATPEEMQADFDFAVERMADRIFESATGLTPEQGIIGKKKFENVMARAPLAGMLFYSPIISIGFETLNQAKNAIVSSAKKEKYDPLEQKLLSELIPESIDWKVRLGSSVAENLTDIALMGAAANLAKEGMLKSTLKTIGEKLTAAGYGEGKVTITKEMIKNAAKGTSLEQNAKWWLKSKTVDIPKKMGNAPDAIKLIGEAEKGAGIVKAGQGVAKGANVPENGVSAQKNGIPEELPTDISKVIKSSAETHTKDFDNLDVTKANVPKDMIGKVSPNKEEWAAAWTEATNKFIEKHPELTEEQRFDVVHSAFTGVDETGFEDGWELAKTLHDKYLMPASEKYIKGLVQNQSDSALIEEAKKYKTVDEFVKAQNKIRKEAELKFITENAELPEFQKEFKTIRKTGLKTDIEKLIRTFKGKNVKLVLVSKNLEGIEKWGIEETKTVTDIEKFTAAKQNVLGEQLSKQQLTNIWNKAHEETQGVSEQQSSFDFAKPKEGVIITSKGKASNESEEILASPKKLPDTGRKDIVTSSGKSLSLRECPFAVSFHKKGVLQFPAQKVTNPADIAFAFKHLKSNAVEHLYLGAMKGNEVYNVELISIGTINSSQASIMELSTLLNEKGVDGFFLVHNHPSGIVDASPQDIVFTNKANQVASRIGKKSFGHIIINDTEFGFIDENGNVTKYKHQEYAKMRNINILEKYVEWKEAKGNRPQIKSASDVYEIVKGIERDQKTGLIFYLDSQNKIMSLQVENAENITGELIFKNMASNRSISFITVGLNKNQYQAIKNFPKMEYEHLDNIELTDYGYKSYNDEGIISEPIVKYKTLSSIETSISQKVAEDLETSYEKHKDIWFANKDQRIQLEIPNEKKALQTKIKSSVSEKKYGKKAIDTDVAIQLYIDNKRNPAQVDELYESLPDDKKKIIDLSKKLTPEQQKVADEISKSYDAIGLEAQEADVIKNVLDNYAARIWDIEGKQATEKFRKFGATTRHAKQRVFDTIAQGWANGLELKVNGATNNLAILKEEVVKAIEDKKFIKALQKVKDVDGNPLLTTNQLEGYVRIEHPNFKVWKWAGKAEAGESYGRNFFIDDDGNLFEKRELYAPKEQANNLNNILGASKLKGVKLGPIDIDAITKFNAISKAWILQTSLFHHMAFTRSYYLGTNRKTLAEMNEIDAINAGNRMIEEMNPVIVQGVRNGLTLGIKQDWNEDLLKEKTAIGKFLDKNNVTKAIKDKILKLREDQAEFLFNVVGSGLKAKAFDIEYRNQVRKYPNDNTDDIAKRVANLINDDFGGLHLQRMGRNPTAQHIFRLLALAPDWTESNIRTMIKSFKGGKEGAMYRHFWAGILAKGIVATALVNMAMATFDEDDENGKGAGERFIRNYRIAAREGKFRWLDVDITPLYKALGGKSNERYYFSILGHFKDPMKLTIRNDRAKEGQITSTLALGNTQAMKHKASVIGRIFTDFLTGTDYAERRFTTLKELVGLDTEKGVYKTTRKGKYKKGDPKWGKLKGQTVTWDYAKRGAVETEQLPSFLINQAIGTQPVQVQNMIRFFAGELDGFMALGNALGLGISRTYGNEPEEITKNKFNDTSPKDKKTENGKRYIKKNGIWQEVTLK